MKSKILTPEEIRAIKSSERFTTDVVVTCPGSSEKFSCLINSTTGGNAIKVEYGGSVVGLICNNGNGGTISCCDGYVVANVSGTNQYGCVPKPKPDPEKPDPEEPSPNPGGGNGTGSEGGSGDNSGDGTGTGTGTGTGSEGDPAPNPTGTGKNLL